MDLASDGGNSTLDQVCSCVRGFILDVNEKNCTGKYVCVSLHVFIYALYFAISLNLLLTFLHLDVDECSSNLTNACNQICTNIPGGLECSCMSGFELESDGFTCVGKYFCCVCLSLQLWKYWHFDSYIVFESFLN